MGVRFVELRAVARKITNQIGWLAQLGEHCPYKAGAVGSSPAPPTIKKKDTMEEFARQQLKEILGNYINHLPSCSDCREDRATLYSRMEDELNVAIELAKEAGAPANEIPTPEELDKVLSLITVIISATLKIKEDPFHAGNPSIEHMLFVDQDLMSVDH
jgi:hypothetical protein